MAATLQFPRLLEFGCRVNVYTCTEQHGTVLPPESGNQLQRVREVARLPLDVTVARGYSVAIISAQLVTPTNPATATSAPLPHLILMHAPVLPTRFCCGAKLHDQRSPHVVNGGNATA